MTQSSALLAIAALAATIAGLPSAAQAQVYKCKQADGKTSYQAAPCPNAHPAAPAPAPAPATAAPPPGPSQQPYYDAYAPENASKRATIKPPPPPQPEPVDLPPVSVNGVPMNGHPGERAPHINQAVANEIKRANMFNRVQRCDYARQQLAVAKSSHQIYRLDNNADKHYVQDADRSGEIAAAQARVAEDCN